MITDGEHTALIYERDGARGYLLGSTASVELVRLELEPGGCIPDHALPFRVTFLVQMGEPTLSTGASAPRTAQTGDMLDVAADAHRGWSNSTDAIAVILVVKQLQT